MSEQAISELNGALIEPDESIGDTSADVVILGIGNSLMGDDGAGVHVINRLRANGTLPAQALLVDGGTLGFSLMEQVESARVLIVVDAMHLDTEPGTVASFVDEELDGFLAAPTQRSVHDANLGDVLRMCALLGTLPTKRILIGIQPEILDWSAVPSDAVSRGIDEACNLIDGLVKEYC